MDLKIAEKLATSKFPIKGKCPSSAFMNGWHRCGIVPVYSVLDGGIPGDSARVVCLHCGEFMTDKKGELMRYFIIKMQPNELSA
ncbi:MAG: hypothetical protein A3K22_05760 [Deltaproteobacteria bacterium RBG_16_42_7]|nr:MAG: hypothetical protein A3K22_05760 [Deltaproteobacteria bacterium RBG_16_42_7]